MADIRPGAEECDSDPVTVRPSTKRRIPKLIGGEGTGGWHLKLGSRNGRPVWVSGEGSVVSNRAKGTREESRSAGPRGPQERFASASQVAELYPRPTLSFAS